MNEIFDLIREAGRLVTAPAAAEISAKGRSNFVTDRDVAVQEFIRKGLSALYPAYGFMSEEQDNAPDYEQPLWILDPIDGTANFITRYGLSAISLALMVGGEVVFGAVYNPYTDELFSAEKGKGAFLNGEPIHADNDVTFEDALIDLGTMPYYKDRADEVGAMAAAIIKNASDIRRCGSAALAMCYASCGRTAAMIEGLLQPWDYAAGMLIAKEAGAITADWDENPLTAKAPSSVLVAGKKVYQPLVNLICEVLKQ